MCNLMIYKYIIIVYCFNNVYCILYMCLYGSEKSLSLLHLIFNVSTISKFRDSNINFHSSSLLNIPSF